MAKLITLGSVKNIITNTKLFERISFERLELEYNNQYIIADDNKLEGL